MSIALYRVTLRCHHTGGTFDVWTEKKADAPNMAARLEATILDVAPSTRAAQELALLETILGTRPQLRF